jgi:hypothetical protein
MRRPRPPRNFALADLNPLLLPRHIEVDDLIDEFLQRPVDSRLDASPRRSDVALPGESPSPTGRPVPRTRTSLNRVVFDWDSSIRQISDRYLRERPLARTAGLPDIARREIMQEEMERRRRYFRLEQAEDDAARARQVFPLRKDEIPNVRADPGILRPQKRRRKSVLLRKETKDSV